MCFTSANRFGKEKSYRTKPNENTIYSHSTVDLVFTLKSTKLLLKIDEIEICNYEICKCGKGLTLLIHLPGIAHIVPCRSDG